MISRSQLKRECTPNCFKIRSSDVIESSISLHISISIFNRYIYIVILFIFIPIVIFIFASSYHHHHHDVTWNFPTIFIKLCVSTESEQIADSYKVRSAFSKIFKVIQSDPQAKERGFTTSSSGKHDKTCVRIGKCNNVCFNIHL